MQGIRDEEDSRAMVEEQEEEQVKPRRLMEKVRTDEGRNGEAKVSQS